MPFNRCDGGVEYVRSFGEQLPLLFHTLKAHIPPAKSLCTRSFLMIMIKGAFCCDDKLKCTATLKAILQVIWIKSLLYVYTIQIILHLQTMQNTKQPYTQIDTTSQTDRQTYYKTYRPADMKKTFGRLTYRLTNRLLNCRYDRIRQSNQISQVRL